MSDIPSAQAIKSFAAQRSDRDDAPPAPVRGDTRDGAPATACRGTDRRGSPRPGETRAAWHYVMAAELARLSGTFVSTMLVLLAVLALASSIDWQFACETTGFGAACTGVGSGAQGSSR